MLTPEEDASDFQLFPETPEEARANDARAEREEKERIERAQEEAKKASPDLDFSAPEEQKQDADTIIRKTAPGSSGRVNAFMKLPDGEHTVDGKKFTKNGFQFERDGQKLSARGIERSFKDVPKAKEDMPLYLATAQTNQNSFPQAENSDGVHNINQDSEKIKDETGESAEKDYSLKRHKVNPVKEEGSFADQVQRDLDEQQAHFAEKQSMSNAKATEAAEEWIKQQGGYEKAIRYVAQGRTMPQGSVRTEIMYLIHNSPEFKALPRETQKQFTQSHGEHTSFLGQELQALRNDALTLDTVEKVNARIEKYTESLGDTEYQELRNVIKEKTGVDLADLPPEIIHDKHKLDQVLRETLTRSLPFFKSLPDRLSELWINFLLSGLRTHTKNTAGNLLNAAYELGPKRFTEAAINLIARKKDAATFGEFKELFRHVDWESAWEGAKESFDLEVLFLT